MGLKFNKSFQEYLLAKGALDTNVAAKVKKIDCRKWNVIPEFLWALPTLQTKCRSIRGMPILDYLKFMPKRNRLLNDNNLCYGQARQLESY
jgi:hypothetical protein